MKKNRAPKTNKSPKTAKAKKPAICAIKGCKKIASSEKWCRLHYLMRWREHKEEALVRAERRLNAYVDRLAKRYPDDYLEKIKEGIENEDAFKKTMEQLEIDTDTEQPETEREYLERLVRNIKPEE